VVDVCKGHGTWFDCDEMRRIVAFIRAGGLETARSKQLGELTEQRRAVTQAQTFNLPEGLASAPPSVADDWNFAITMTADFLKGFFGR
jgi:hypothetical protein